MSRTQYLSVLAALAMAGCSDQVNPDPCAWVTCSSRGFCIAEEGIAYCACMLGHHPVGLTCVVNDADLPCDGVDCSAHGVCRGDATAITCDCDPGYAHLDESDPRCASMECDLLCVPDADDDADAESDFSPDTAVDVDADAGVETEAAVSPVCGNGDVETGEECDDGNDDDTDACVSGCRNAFCGDGFILAGTEDCEGASVTSCATACGTVGTQSCVACRWAACAPPAEICNGLDDDCANGPDDGFSCVVAASTSCVASCGSTGTQSCSAACEWEACVPPAETCDGTDNDCDTTCDNGFGCCRGRTRSCTTSCGSTGSQTCGSSCTWRSCAPPSETCNGTDDDCDTTCDNGWACCSGATRSCTRTEVVPDCYPACLPGVECGRICGGGHQNCQSTCAWGVCVGATDCGAWMCTE